MLDLRVPLGDGETPTSFCSRLALRNCYADVQEFCSDMGIQFQQIIDGDQSALARLAELGDVDIERLTRWAVYQRSDLFHSIQGQILPRSALRLLLVRVCPACLASDKECWPSLGHAAPYGRVEWLVESIRTCPVHGHPLVTLGDTPEQAHPQDFSRRIAQHFNDLTAQCKDGFSRPFSELEKYLRCRLAGNPYLDTPWLNALPFYATARLCEIVGAVDLHGPQVHIQGLTNDEWWAAGEAGFDVIADGPDGLHRLLRHLASHYWYSRNGAGPEKLFGRLYDWLSNMITDSAYDPARDVIRQFVFNTLPVGPGEEVLGQSLTKRRIHSIHSASVETGIRPKRLRKRLVARGFINEDDLDLSDDHLLFQATPNAIGFLEHMTRRDVTGR